MNFIRITNSRDYVYPDGHFRFSEFFHPTLNPNDVEYDCPECLIKGAEILRSYFNTAWEITSTIRPFPNQAFHIKGNAFDSVPSDDLKKIAALEIFRIECLKYQNGSGSQLIKDLRSVGVQGLGIEGSCIHLDWRNDKNCADIDEFGKYIVFGWQLKKQPDGTLKGVSTVYYAVR